jgi:hypothetical protein
VKLLFSILLIFIFNFNSLAQSDSLAIFHQPIHGNAKDKTSHYNNALSFNLFQITRGSALLSYERLLGNTGFTASAGLGICKFDALGQIYLRELTQYYKSGESVTITKIGTTIKPLFEIGLKYYTQDFLGGNYFGAAFTSINNQVNLKESYESYTLPSNFHKLNYRSNDFKFMFGFSNRNDKKFYNDISIGVGYRFINYEYLTVKDTLFTSLYSTVSEDIIKEESTNQTIWIFTAWKMGIRF